MARVISLDKSEDIALTLVSTFPINEVNVALRLASLPKAVAISFNVSSVAGAAPTKLEIAESTYVMLALSAMSVARSDSACVARVTSSLNEELTEDIFDSALVIKLPSIDSACVARVTSSLNEELTEDIFDSALVINDDSDDDAPSMLFCKVVSAVARTLASESMLFCKVLSAVALASASALMLFCKVVSAVTRALASALMLFCKVVSAVARALASVANAVSKAETLELTLDISEVKLAFTDDKLDSVFPTRLVNALSRSARFPLSSEFTEAILDSALVIKFPSAISAAVARATSVAMSDDSSALMEDRSAVDRLARVDRLASMPDNLSSIVVAKFGSSPKAAASSLRVSSVPGAEATKLARVLDIVVLTFRSV